MAKGTVQVYIFTMENCAPCKTLKESLASRFESNTFLVSSMEKDMSVRVNLEMIDMSDPSEHNILMSAKYNIRGAPTTVVLKPDSTEIYYIGTNKVKTSSDLIDLVAELI
jgi:thiol-disulfide isomerase/thioredoxin